MKILIVEDEPLAAAQLAANIAALKPGAQIMAVCDTVKSAVNWVQNNPAPDLSFFDIQLGDGLSFEIFDKSGFQTTCYFHHCIQSICNSGF
jgi:DNA-binding LytR/AlgR family response regulator